MNIIKSIFLFLLGFFAAIILQNNSSFFHKKENTSPPKVQENVDFSPIICKENNEITLQENKTSYEPSPPRVIENDNSHYEVNKDTTKPEDTTNTNKERKLMAEISEQFLTPEMEGFRGDSDFEAFYYKYEMDNVIDSWALDMESNIRNNIPQSEDFVINSILCKQSICVFSGEANSIESFTKIYDKYASDEHFLGYFGNSFTTITDGSGNIKWVWAKHNNSNN